MNFAKKVGADHVVLVKPGQKPEEIAKEVCAFNDGNGFPKVFECSGAEVSIQTGLLVCTTYYLVNKYYLLNSYLLQHMLVFTLCLTRLVWMGFCYIAVSKYVE